MVETFDSTSSIYSDAYTDIAENAYGSTVGGTDASGLIAILGIIALYVGIFSIVALVPYILNAIGVYKMGKSLNLAHAWFAFIPVFNTYAFGKVAECYVKANGKPSAKFSKILLAIYFSMFAAVLLMYISVICFILIKPLQLQPAVLLIIFFFFYFAVLALGIAYTVVYSVALWRMFAIFSPDNATVLLILSMFISLAGPIITFVIRNNTPRFNPTPQQYYVNQYSEQIL